MTAFSERGTISPIFRIALHAVLVLLLVSRAAAQTPEAESPPPAVTPADGATDAAPGPQVLVPAADETIDVADPAEGPPPAVTPADGVTDAAPGPQVLVPAADETIDVADPAEDPPPTATPPGGVTDAAPGPRVLVPAADETIDVADPAEGGQDSGIPPAFQVPDVTVGALPSARPGWGGVLSESEGGLGWTMWDGTDAALAARLLTALPDVPASPATRNLTRRLLLSRAAAPVPPARGELVRLGPDGQPLAVDSSEIPDFLDERIHRLVRLADGEGLALLAQGLELEATDPDLAERLLEGRILAGDADRACADVLQQLTVRPTPRVRSALAVCQIREGAFDAAQLTLQLLGGVLPADNLVLILGYAILDGAAVPPGLDIPANDYLALTLLANGNGQLGQYPHAASLPVLRAIAEGRAEDTGLQLSAAERAARMGVLRDGALAKAYAAFPFAPEQLASAGTEADALHPSLARALLFQAALQATTAIDRARFLRLLWDRAEPDPGFVALAEATGAVAATVDPRQDLAWFSAAAARSLLASSRYADAEDWVRMLAGSADLDYVTSGQLYALFPALALAGRPLPEPFEVFPRETVRVALPRVGSPAEHANRLSKLLVVLEAMDIPVPQGSWITLLDDAALQSTVTIPSAPARYQLRDAAAKGRTAETVLFVLSILGDRGPAAADPLTLNAAIRSLRAVGLDSDARAIALEAVI